MWMQIDMTGLESPLRDDLIAFVGEFSERMTLAQAREWFEEAFEGRARDRDLNTP
ncbi:MAG: hypothetical protein ACYDG0_04035 [Vulcanimicrobiaceae bacterium]